MKGGALLAPCGGSDEGNRAERAPQGHGVCPAASKAREELAESRQEKSEFGED